MTLMNLILEYLELEKNPFGKLHTITEMPSGFRNDNYLLTTSQGKYKLRVPKYSISLEELLAEQAVLKWASKKSNIIVPLLKLFTLPDGTNISVFPFIDADSKFDLDNKELMCNAGKALAGYHLVIEEYKGETSWKPLYESLNVNKVKIEELKAIINEQSLSGYPKFWDAVENLLSRMHKMAKQFNDEPYISLPHITCHGDYSPSNLLASHDKIVGIIDFECSRWAPRVFDVAVFLLALKQNERYEEPMSYWFLDGYQSIIPLSEIELELIPAFQIIRSLEAFKGHVNNVVQGDFELSAGLVMYWDRITILN